MGTWAQNRWQNSVAAEAPCGGAVGGALDLRQSVLERLSLLLTYCRSIQHVETILAILITCNLDHICHHTHQENNYLRRACQRVAASSLALSKQFHSKNRNEARYSFMNPQGSSPQCYIPILMYATNINQTSRFTVVNFYPVLFWWIFEAQSEFRSHSLKLEGQNTVP